MPFHLSCESRRCKTPPTPPSPLHDPPPTTTSFSECSATPTSHDPPSPLKSQRRRRRLEAFSLPPLESIKASFLVDHPTARATVDKAKHIANELKNTEPLPNARSEALQSSVPSITADSYSPSAEDLSPRCRVVEEVTNFIPSFLSQLAV